MAIVGGYGLRQELRLWEDGMVWYIYAIQPGACVCRGCVFSVIAAVKTRIQNDLY